MKCEEVELNMIDYLDNSIDQAEKNEIEKHLATCERCLDCFTESQKVLRIFAGVENHNPDDKLRINFYHMLHSEIKKQAAGLPVVEAPFMEAPLKPMRISRVFLVAAGLALILAGTLIGILLGPSIQRQPDTDQIQNLQAQIDALRKNEMFSMLNKASSSYRLQGVSYADEMDKADDSVIDALIRVLNTDENVNVRLAAAFSLSKFTDKQVVCDSLVASLPKQKDPILQITLINVLTGIKEKSALRSIQHIIKNESTLPEVRNIAEKGAKELML